jgi:hypothetical protein
MKGLKINFFLDIIHRPSLNFKHDVSEIGTSSIDWAQQSRYYLRTETDSSLRNVVFLIEIGTMDNVQKEVYFNNTPSSQTFRFK